MKLIDQRLLPHQFSILACPTYQHTAEAIRTMAVRGAGAIGAAAGYAVAQAVLAAPTATYRDVVNEAAATIRATRPTARDLFYAVEQVMAAVQRASDVVGARASAVAMAQRLADENVQAGERIGQVGAHLLGQRARVLTHCNAGWLAFADWGSALAPIYVAHREHREPFVYATETRPRGQGARLTVWELSQEGVACALIADTACGWLFQRGEIDCVIVGADRIAANGDTANKIGTYTLALLAQHHRVPFYVAAPRSTFDLSTPNGAAIVIEDRSPDEVLWVSGKTREGLVQDVRVSVEGVSVRNPAFDVTPACLIHAFLTEGGLVRPTVEAIAAFVHERTPV